MSHFTDSGIKPPTNRLQASAGVERGTGRTSTPGPGGRPLKDLTQNRIRAAQMVRRPLDLPSDDEFQRVEPEGDMDEEIVLVTVHGSFGW